MLLFGFLVSWSNHVAPLPIRGLSALEVFPRILGVGIGLEVLWHSLLFVGFWGFDDVEWLCAYLLLPMPRGWRSLYGLVFVRSVCFLILPPVCSLVMIVPGGWGV